MFDMLVACKSALPRVGAVGAKIRLGLNATEANAHKVYLQVAAEAAEAGLDYIVLHARHAQQGSSVPAEWNRIKEVKEFVRKTDIKVIGNGDAASRARCLELKQTTGCDGVMIGRGAIHNPWIFRSLGELSSRDSSVWPTIEELDMAEARMNAWAKTANTQNRMVSFHTQNFQRIRDYLYTGTMHVVKVPKADRRKSRLTKSRKERRGKTFSRS